MSFALGFLVAFLVLALGWVIRRRRFKQASWRYPFRGLFSRLGTSAAQEQVFLDESSSLREELRALRTEWTVAREELAVLLGEEKVEAKRVEEVLAARDARLAAFRRRAAQGLARFHGALDEGQRKVLRSAVREGGLHAHGRCR